MLLQVQTLLIMGKITMTRELMAEEKELSNAAVPGGSIVESATHLPLAYDVDVVVAGATLPGIEAACSAADRGASVLVVDSRPYLGSDICANQKLWLDPGEKAETALTKKLFQDKRMVTPLEVKSALDHALLKHKVQFLTGTFPAELLVNAKGDPGGLTVVNRSGRQAIRAKVIIDATPHAVLTRQMGSAIMSPFMPRQRRATYTVIGGTLKAGTDIVKGRQVPGLEPMSWDHKEKKWIPNSIYHYNVKVNLNADSYRSHSRALLDIRSVVYDADMTDHSEDLLMFPEQKIRAASTEAYESPDQCPVDLFRPKGVDNLYVLSAYAGIREEPVRRQLLVSPCTFAIIGKRIGVAAAEVAKRMPASSHIDHQAGTHGKRDLVVSELPSSFRFRNCKQQQLSDHDLPVLGRWDVVVIGGGTSGAPAALGAARSGAQTLVIEYMPKLGGVGTVGRITDYWYGLDRGFSEEMGKAIGRKTVKLMEKSEWLRNELVKNGVEIWFNSFGCGAVMKGNKVCGVVVVTPYGRGVVLTDVVVDATGNSDIPAAAGARTSYSISALGQLSVQISNYPLLKLGTQIINIADCMVNDNDIFDRSHLMLSKRISVSAQDKGRKGEYDVTKLIPSRDRRRTIGDYMLTVEDILTHRSFPDTICHHMSNFDAGAFPDTKAFLIKDMKGPVFHSDMPYRCLTPKGLEGILVVGLGASAERDAMTLVRMQRDLQNQGYAAGMAAARACSESAGLVRKIDLKALQKALVENGCLEERVLNDRDSFPMGDQVVKRAVEALKDLTISVHQKRAHDDTLPALAVVMGNPQIALPLLQEAFRSSDSPEQKLNFARILSFLGDDSGKEVLLQAIKGSDDWGKGWDYSTQREHANTFGEVDRIVMALGFLQTPEVRKPLLRKLEQLTAESHLSHYKALCLALRLNKDPSMAGPLAALLNKEGVKGHVQRLGYYGATGAGGHPHKRHLLNAHGGAELNSKYKELLVAALLFECGDDNGQGRKVLEAYTEDVNGHFAEYAHLVLSKGTAMAK
jgi:flavin-dependent dehydrogenase